ncbi:hypothetical protein BD847_4128 [Flavobacterium cutihirudinis]|uniref:Uncharacterized protein n=1 Tax=Flavobacterium cutihirudinis TaxID=1265740 RepID=A0A3D9FL90_9FLAO|nr:tetratricopeptide repeat-containing sensor histidine kinase [Flavobacterium cutihirudinis]RED18881.1 hypothetical protein BD847_4128 [Flavobacterium cutihirudinis]
MMIKNLIQFFQKKYTVFCLLLFCSVLAISFSVQYYEAKEKEIKYIKKDQSVEIKKRIEKGNAFLNAGKSDSAFLYFNKAQLICNPKENYVDDYVYSLTNIADIQHRNGDFYEAETTLTKTFPYLEKTSKPKFAINVYSLMANNYSRTYDNENGLLYQKKALKKAVSTFRKAAILSDIGFIYLQQERYKEAIDLLEPLTKRKIVDKIEPKYTDIQRSAILYNLGMCYLRIGNHKELALNCFNESLELTLKTKDDYELIANYFALYSFYKTYNNPKLKKIYAQKAYDCAKKVKASTYQINMLANLIEADNAENSQKHWETYIRMVDSTLISRKKAQNQFANIIYDSNKDKAENLELKNKKVENELQLERQKNRSTISYVIITFSVFLVLFLSLYMSSKGKKEKIEAINESELRISKKLHDELANDVYETLSFATSNDMKNFDNKEKLLSNLDQIYYKARNISKENSLIKTNEEYLPALKEMISGYKTPSVNILLNGFDSLDWNKLDRSKKIILYRVLQELFENMKKHSNASLVSFTIKINDKNLMATYIDNGDWTKNNRLILKNGLQNVENRIKTINGTITFVNNLEKGFKASFNFPI